MKPQGTSDLDVTQCFAANLVEAAGAQAVLHIRGSPFNVFGDPPATKTLVISRAEEIPDEAVFDVILGEFPLGMGVDSWSDKKDGVVVKAQRSWVELLRSLGSLEESGVAAFLLEADGLGTPQGQEFKQQMDARGFFLHGVFKTPDSLLKPEASFPPVIVTVSRAQRNKLFVAELLKPEQVKEVVNNYVLSRQTNSLITGTFAEAEDFVGFHRLRVQLQIQRLRAQHKHYQTYRLSDLAEEINTIKSGSRFKERQNAVYIPILGPSPVVCRLQEAQLKHHNYFQVVLGQHALNEYVASFLGSALGKLVLESVTSQTLIPHVNKRDIGQAMIALPSTEEQSHVVRTHRKLDSLRRTIDRFAKELSLNPASSQAIQGQLDRMLETLRSLADVDSVRNLVRGGESKTVEFEETLAMDARTNKKEKCMETLVVKTLVAFLNTQGGTLLIGVKDDGEVVGIEGEIDKRFKNSTKFLLHVKNLIKQRIGEAAYGLVACRLVAVEGKQVVLVECKASQDPCYLDGKDLYVRTTSATAKLEGPRLGQYLKHRFGI